MGTSDRLRMLPKYPLGESLEQVQTKSEVGFEIIVTSGVSFDRVSSEIST